MARLAPCNGIVDRAVPDELNVSPAAEGTRAADRSRPQRPEKSRGFRNACASLERSKITALGARVRSGSSKTPGRRSGNQGRIRTNFSPENWLRPGPVAHRSTPRGGGAQEAPPSRLFRGRRTCVTAAARRESVRAVARWGQGLSCTPDGVRAKIKNRVYEHELSDNYSFAVYMGITAPLPEDDK